MTDLIPSTEVRRETRVHLGHQADVWTRWCVIGDAGAAVFMLRTGAGRDDLAWGIDAHHLAPQWEDHLPSECDLLPGGKCYCDGSALQAGELWARVKASGTDEKAPDEGLIWVELEDRYARWIEKQDEPVAVASDERQL